MFVEEGFRIRFANGEAIDFYADSAADKDKWMAALSGVVGNGSADNTVMGWCDIVLKRERMLQQCAEQAAKTRPRSQGQEVRTKLPFATSGSNTMAMKSVPSSPVKHMQVQVPMGLGIQGTVPRKQAEIVHQAVGPGPNRLMSRRKQVRSMIF
jgi:hypothetical protein